MCGAAYLSASAALHGGAGNGEDPDCGGKPGSSCRHLLPEAMVTCEFEEEANEKNLNWCDVLVIGPGLGTEGTGRERLLWFLRKRNCCEKDGDSGCRRAESSFPASQMVFLYQRKDSADAPYGRDEPSYRMGNFPPEGRSGGSGT